MYVFYYDESEHSRSITKNTVKAENFFDGFIATTVGWKDSDEEQLENEYLDFESRYKSPKALELKSTSINNSQLKNGFASSSKNTVALVGDLLSIFDERTLLYYSHASKLEFIIRQVLVSHSVSMGPMFNDIVYSITKAIVLYRPTEVITALYGTPIELLTALRHFFQNQVNQDKANYPLKHREIEAFRVILFMLDRVDLPTKLDWNYRPPFDGFTLYLNQHNINEYSLLIDKETSTADAARSVGLSPVDEGDSINHFGLRAADMIAGLIAKLMKAFSSATQYTDNKSRIEKRLLPDQWFRIDNNRLQLYHKLYRILVENDACWYKAYASTYSDNLVALLGLLEYFHRYQTVEELRRSPDIHGTSHSEMLNTLLCHNLEDSFQRSYRQNNQLMSL